MAITEKSIRQDKTEIIFIIISGLDETDLLTGFGQLECQAGQF
jgi:hypothetical protein